MLADGQADREDDNYRCRLRIVRGMCRQAAPNVDQFLQVPTFAGWTSLTLSRFVFSFAYTYVGIVPGL